MKFFLLGVCLRLQGVYVSLCVVLFQSFWRLRTEERKFFSMWKKRHLPFFFFSQEALTHRVAESPVVDNLNVRDVSFAAGSQLSKFVNLLENMVEAKSSQDMGALAHAPALHSIPIWSGNTCTFHRLGRTFSSLTRLWQDLRSFRVSTCRLVMWMFIQLSVNMHNRLQRNLQESRAIQQWGEMNCSLGSIDWLTRSL